MIIVWSKVLNIFAFGSKIIGSVRSSRSHNRHITQYTMVTPILARAHFLLFYLAPWPWAHKHMHWCTHFRCICLFFWNNFIGSSFGSWVQVWACEDVHNLSSCACAPSLFPPVWSGLGAAWCLVIWVWAPMGVMDVHKSLLCSSLIHLNFFPGRCEHVSAWGVYTNHTCGQAS